MKLLFAAVLVAISGFISLSYEILWFRVFAFTTGRPAIDPMDDGLIVFSGECAAVFHFANGFVDRPWRHTAGHKDFADHG